MPKVKIGEKVTAGEEASKEKRVFNNGHKSFTAMEAKQITENYERERATLNAFERRKHALMAPRNPIIGEETPRMVYDELGVGTMSGQLLFPPNRYSRSSLISGGSTVGEMLSSRMGTSRAGDRSSRMAESENPLKRSDPINERIGSLRSKQMTIEEELNELREKIKQKEQAVHAAATAQVRF